MSNNRKQKEQEIFGLIKELMRISETIGYSKYYEDNSSIDFTNINVGQKERIETIKVLYGEIVKKVEKL